MLEAAKAGLHQKTAAKRPSRSSAGAVNMADDAVHAGPVSVMELYNARVWTSGGSHAAYTLLEWDRHGHCIASSDVSEAGRSNAHPACMHRTPQSVSSMQVSLIACVLH